MKIFGIDPGSERTGYGCLDTDGRRHRLVCCGSLAAPPRSAFPERLLVIHAGLAALLAELRPDCVAIENIFYAKNVRSALKLGHARGIALLAASQAALPVIEYAPAEIKRAVVGFGRAEKHQVAEMVRLMLGLDASPDAARRDRRDRGGHLSRAQLARGDGRRPHGARRHPAQLAPVPAVHA